MRKLVLTFFLFFSIFFPASADDIDDARDSAVKVLRKLEQGTRKEVWKSDISVWFKQRMTEDAFIANVTIINAQLGGVGSERKLIQQNKADGDPKAGFEGSVYSFMYRTTFPAASVYETISMIKENGVYKLSGFNYIPNPNK